jgi:hypothetical protein
MKTGSAPPAPIDRPHLFHRIRPHDHERLREHIAILRLPEADGDIRLMPLQADRAVVGCRLDIELRMTRGQLRETQGEKAARQRRWRVDSDEAARRSIHHGATEDMGRLLRIARRFESMRSSQRQDVAAGWRSGLSAWAQR